VTHAIFVLLQARVSVEWGFGLVTNTFQTTDFARWNRMFLTRPALQYRVATLLRNCITCIRGSNQISRFFHIDPPSLDDFLAENWD
jgi:hypothetical protein